MPYEGFIAFIRGRLTRGGKITLVKTASRFYAHEVSPEGVVLRWWYSQDADAEAIAKEVGIPLVDKEPFIHDPRWTGDYHDPP